MSETEGLKIGIDFGSCYIKAAGWNKKKSRAKRLYLDKNQEDSDYRLPNTIMYQINEDGSLDKVVGDEEGCRFEPDNSVKNIKYLLQQSNWKKYIPNLQKEISADCVLEDIFKYIKDTLEEQSGGKEISEVAITVPVCFSEIQKMQIVNAALKADFPVKEVISEPLAAMFAFLDEFENGTNYVMVFDFGGSTLDLNLLKIDKKDENIAIEMLASEGVLYGGININSDIYENVFSAKYTDVLDFINTHIQSENLKEDLLDSIEKIKRMVYRDGSREWRPYTGENFVRELELLPEEFESMLKELRRNKEIINAIDNLLEQGCLSKENLTKLILVGGSARIGFFRDVISKYLNLEPMDIDEDDMYSAVSMGAVTYLHLKENSSFSISNKLPYSVGIVDDNNIFVTKVKKGVRYGHKERKTKTPSTDGKIIVYQTFLESCNENVIDNRKIIYMGYFDISKHLDSIDKLFTSFVISKDGNLKLDLYSGSSYVTTEDLIME